MKDNKYLGEEKITKLLLKFAMPCIFSLLVSALYNVIDQIFIGNSKLGYLGNAATSIIFPITFISFAFAWCFGDGAVALISLRQGQKSGKGVDKIVGNGIMMNIIASLVFIFVGFVFMEPLLRVFGASDASLPIAKSYLSITLCAATAAMTTGILTGVIRADGSPAFSMIVTLSGAILNLVLDPVFIFGLDWGIEGAAVATIIGQIVSFVLGLYFVFFKSRTFKLKLDSFKLDRNTVIQFTKLGISTFITQISIVLTALVSNIILAKYGAQSEYGVDIPIAAMGITSKVFSIVINIVVGLIIGAQPIIGYNYGAKNYKRVKDTIKTVLLFTAIAGVTATFVFEICPDVIINIFGSENELYMEFARKLFRINLALVSFTVLIKAISIFFQSIGEPVKSTISSLSRDILSFIPLCIILPIFMGIDGAILAAPIADLIGMIIAGSFMFKFYRNLGKNADNEQSEIVKIEKSKKGPIIAISRKHGSAGKEIGRLVAEELKIPFYCKELMAVAADESGISEKFIDDLNDRSEGKMMHDLYLGSEPAKFAINAQKEAIREIAKSGSCVIVGRAADYVLRDEPNVIKIFITAPLEYRIAKLKEMYGDGKIKAKKYIKSSDSNRASYYNAISGLEWGDVDNYDLTLNSEIGNMAAAKAIVQFVKQKYNGRS